MIWQQLNYRWIQKTRFREVWNYSNKGKVFAVVGLFCLIAAILLYFFVTNAGLSYSLHLRNVIYLSNALLFSAPVMILAYWQMVYLDIFATKLNKFAKDNKPYFDQFSTKESAYNHDGYIRSISLVDLTKHEFSGAFKLPFKFGNEWLVWKSVGYIRFELPRTLPNMILDAKSNNRGFLTQLPSKVRKDQKVSLEGDFEKYYTLYAPLGYDTDALYVFTPDIMELLIETGAHYDIEIVDNSLYVYNDSKFRFDSVEQMQEITWLIEALSEKFARRVDSYSDSRIGNTTANEVTEHAKVLHQRNGLLKTYQLMSEQSKPIITGIILFLLVFLIGFGAVLLRDLFILIF